jgi:hypothetical protein
VVNVNCMGEVRESTGSMHAPGLTRLIACPRRLTLAVMAHVPLGLTSLLTSAISPSTHFQSMYHVLLSGPLSERA